MKNVLIIDVETNGLDPKKNDVIEVGCVLWSVAHHMMLEVYSGLCRAKENECEDINGISSGVLREVKDNIAWETTQDLANQVDAYVAHNAEFDRSFCESMLPDKPWICTIDDFTWPKQSPKQSLSEIALRHGVGLVAAHRAVNDCLVLARLFEQVHDSSDRLRKALVHAKLPRKKVIAKVSYDDRDLAKDEFFKWDREKKQWWRRMPLVDAEKLPFPWKEIE